MIDADHLQHGRQPVDPVVGVVGRGEPAEVDPGPADGEHREKEAASPAAIWPPASTWANCAAATPNATTKVRSNSSSSGVATRCDSCGSRPVIRRTRCTSLAGRCVSSLTDRPLSCWPSTLPLRGQVVGVAVAAVRRSRRAHAFRRTTTSSLTTLVEIERVAATTELVLTAVRALLAAAARHRSVV